MVVREAIEGDKTQYLRMVKDFHAEGQFPFALDLPRQSAIFDVSMTDERFRLWVVEDGGQLRGYLLAACQIASLSGEKVGQELMLWVDKPSRHGLRAFEALHSAFDAWGRECGADRMNLSVQASMRPEATGRLFARYGYRATETHYTRRS